MKKLLYVFLLFLVFSCTTTKYVEVPVETIKIEYREKVKYDSIRVQDSIIINNNNDTVFIEKYKYIYKIIQQTDTVHIVDSIPKIQVVEVIKEVNKLYNWQIILMIIGGSFIALLGYKIIKSIKI
jgi:hypothetical protein